MKSSSVFRLVVMIAATSALSACVVAPYPQQQAVYAQPGYDQPDVVVGMAPPAPYIETIPLIPFAGAVWIGGYWGWSGNRHQWVPGRYERPRPGYRMEPHRWNQGPHGSWHLRGGWVR